MNGYLHNLTYTTRHVMVGEDLARQSNPRQVTSRKAFLFGSSHLRRFTVNELHTACRATGITTASVHDIDASVFDCKHQSLIFGNVKRPISFDR